MNKQCANEIKNANSVKEVLEIFDKYYELNEPFGSFSGGVVKNQISSNLTTIVQKLNLKEKQNNSFLNFK